MNFAQNELKRNPEGAKLQTSGPTWHQKGPNLSQKDTKMNPKGAKGAPKVSPKSTKIPQKIATSKKVEKGGGAPLSVGVNFDFFLSLSGPLLAPLWHPLGSFWYPFGSNWVLFGTLRVHFGVLLAQSGPLLVPCRVIFWLFCTLGVSFWFVVGEIHFLRQYFCKKIHLH